MQHQRQNEEEGMVSAASGRDVKRDAYAHQGDKRYEVDVCNRGPRRSRDEVLLGLLVIVASLHEII